jgi:vacuolar-type H+-ATPase subunit H
MTSTTATPAPTTQEDKDKALKKAYQSATSKLRDAHREDFNRIYKAEAEALGVKWEPRKTAEERAEEEMEDLIRRFPHLAGKVTAPAKEEVEPDLPVESPTPPTVRA